MKEQCDFKMEIGVINNKFSVLVDIIKIWIKYICDKFSPPMIGLISSNLPKNGSKIVLGGRHTNTKRCHKPANSMDLWVFYFFSYQNTPIYINVSVSD